MRALVLGVLVLALALAAPAGAAPLVPLASGGDLAGAPQLLDGQVLWTAPDGPRDLRLLSRPVAGGEPTELARVTQGRRRGSGLGTTPGGGILWQAAVPGGTRRLYGPAGGPLAPVTVGNAFLRVSAAGLVEERPGPRLTEDDPPVDVRVREPGGLRRVAVPRGADVNLTPIAGRFLAVAVRATVVVIDLATGREVRRVQAGADTMGYAPTLEVSPEGDVAVAVQRLDGPDVVAVSRAGERRFRTFPVPGDVFGLALAGGRIAVQTERTSSLRHADGAQVRVYDLADPARPAWTSPVLDAATLTGFDGTFAVFTTQRCQVLADTRDAAPDALLPAGPCTRTQLDLAYDEPTRLRARGAVMERTVRCLSAPEDRCRVRVVAEGFPRRRDGSPRLGLRKAYGSRSFVVATGRERVLRVPLSRAGTRLRRADGTFVATVTVRDPGGPPVQVGR